MSTTANWVQVLEMIYLPLLDINVINWHKKNDKYCDPGSITTPDEGPVQPSFLAFLNHVWTMFWNILWNKANRCLARYSPRTTTTKQPSNGAPYEPYFGPKILIFTGGSKSFGAYVTKNRKGQKCQYLAQNDLKCIFGVKFGRFWAKIPNFNGRKQKFWYPHNGKPHRHLVGIVFWSGMGPNLNI